MSTKLTLTIEKSVIERAKSYAEKNGQSLSHVVETYLRSVTKEETTKEIAFSPMIKSLKGSFKAPSDFSYKEQLEKALAKKYLRDE
ncbi:MAG: DUF6364 family protein [Imperialibacter sp.]|uniref:DUF6364 family protein n=1 Tax=Imperialibacter sp. TaxID=2038411 RepID=UPI0030DA3C0D|tara:strand:+ start:126 stop:383 length:258 start_codon:yes stop_codon:yes gene_type:complete